MITSSEVALFTLFKKYRWVLGEMPKTKTGRRLLDKVLKSIMFLNTTKCKIYIGGDIDEDIDIYINPLTTYEEFVNKINDIYINQYGVRKDNDYVDWVKFFIIESKIETYIKVKIISVSKNLR